MKLNLSDAKAFRELLKNDTILESAFGMSGKKILSSMEENGILSIKRINRRSREINIINHSSFDAYLRNHFSISNLNKYIDILNGEDTSRATLAKAGLNTKIKSNNPKAGFHISSYDSIKVIINSEEVLIDFPIGCALFVHKDSELKFRKDVLIVGVENFTNLSSVKAHKELFKTDKKIIFIERSKYLQRLLGEITNEYLHFGDIDLAGINIYLTEYHPILQDRGGFFVPDTIESDLRKGNGELFEKQYMKYGLIKSEINYIQDLINLINANKTTIEQEFYLA